MDMLEIIETRSNKKVIEAMIEAPSVSVWSRLRHKKEELNFEDAITEWDGFHHMIRVEKFLDTMLDIDDNFAQKVNKVLYGLDKDDSDKVLEILEKEYDDIDLGGYASFSGYTYNSETDLSRDIVYHMFEYEGDPYVFVQVHYGADARVGFGSMVCFRLNDVDYFMAGMNIDAYGSESDNDYCVHELEDIATYDKEEKVWHHNESGEEIYLHTSADGY